MNRSPRPHGHLRRVAAVLAAMWIFAQAGRAHEPFETFTMVSVRPDDLELNLTISPWTMHKLCDPEGKIAGLTPDNFAQHRARIAAAARTLFTVTSLKKALAVRSVVVALTEENDVSVRLVYPRPAEGKLTVQSAYLTKLGEPYGGIIDSADSDGRQLGWEQIAWDKPDLEITVLAASTGAGAEKK